MTPTPMPEVFLRLALAAVLGGAIGLEREYRRKPAGLRTNILIALGSALFSVLSFELGAAAGSPDRIAAQIVTGIGFLGAGAILRSGESVHGLTTAATIWVNAAIGMAAGLGSYALAVGSAVITLVVLAFLPMIERRFGDTDVTPLERVCEPEPQPVLAALTDDDATDVPRPAEREDR
jgi:putative Mg2+ transporter-C (MgtC) family protein